jgi:hypothetical protein
MSSGPQRARDDEDRAAYGYALAKVSKVKSQRLLASLEDIQRDLRDMVDSNIHMTKVNHQRLDDALEEVQALLGG